MRQRPPCPCLSPPTSWGPFSTETTGTRSVISGQFSARADSVPRPQGRAPSVSDGGFGVHCASPVRAVTASRTRVTQFLLPRAGAQRGHPLGVSGLHRGGAGLAGGGGGGNVPGLPRARGEGDGAHEKRNPPAGRGPCVLGDKGEGGEVGGPGGRFRGDVPPRAGADSGARKLLMGGSRAATYTLCPVAFSLEGLGAE